MVVAQCGPQVHQFVDEVGDLLFPRLAGIQLAVPGMVDVFPVRDVGSECRSDSHEAHAADDGHPRRGRDQSGVAAPPTATVPVDPSEVNGIRPTRPSALSRI